MFCPFGICTDVLGHILVCDYFSNTVHLLDQDGGFLSFILSPQQGIKRPRSVCVKNEKYLYVGQHTTNTVTVHKHLQWSSLLDLIYLKIDALYSENSNNAC